MAVALYASALFAIIILCVNISVSDSNADIQYAKKIASYSNTLLVGTVCKDGSLLCAIPFDEQVMQNHHTNTSNVDIISCGSSRWETTDICDDNSTLSSSSRRFLYRVDDLLVAVSGIPSDCHFMMKYIYQESSKYKSMFLDSIPIGKLVDTISDYLNDLRSESVARPLAIDMIVASSEPYYDIVTKILCNDGRLVKINCGGECEEVNVCLSDTINMHTDGNDSIDLVEYFKLLKSVDWKSLLCADACHELAQVTEDFMVKKNKKKLHRLQLKWTKRR